MGIVNPYSIPNNSHTFIKSVFQFHRLQIFRLTVFAFLLGNGHSNNVRKYWRTENTVSSHSVRIVTLFRVLHYLPVLMYPVR